MTEPDWWWETLGGAAAGGAGEVAGNAALQEHQQKLQEQYQAFAKFNEDYISRSLKTTDLAYVS